MHFTMRPKITYQYDGWKKHFAWLPQPVRRIPGKHPVEDRLEYVWLERFWRRYVTTAEGNWAGGYRYVVQQEPAFGTITGYPCNPHLPPTERWESAEYGDD